MAENKIQQVGASVIQAPVVIEIMTAPGLQPDMVIRVFGREYHVHSLIMKTHSAFFRRFLDSPDKTTLSSSNLKDTFKYDWSAKIDEDGSWSLVCVSDKPSKSQCHEFVPSEDINRKVGDFYKLLQAIHSRPFTLDSVAELDRVTQLADYYLALPIFSLAVSGTILNSSWVIPAITTSPDTLVQIAVKLRHKSLLRECAIRLLGPFDYPAYKAFTAWAKEGSSFLGLWKMLETLYERLWAKVGRINYRLENAITIQKTISFPGYRGLVKEISQECTTIGDDGKVCLNLPEYYRELYENEKTPEGVKDILKSLLESRSMLFSDDFEAGFGQFSKSFLCIDIPDEDLPWDMKQKDW